MKILNLYAGLGGNRRLWGDKHQITAIELDTRVAYAYNKLYPDDIIIVGDALEYVQKHFNEFVFIWASPPCQTHTRWRISNAKCIPDLTSLYGLIVFLKQFYKGRFCVENVIPWYKKLMEPTVKLGRHPFWCNFFIPEKQFEYPKWDFMKTKISKLADFHNIDFELIKKLKGPWKNHDMRGQLLRNCVDGNIGKYILDCSQKQIQKTLF